MLTVKVSKKYQLSIPKSLRESAGIKPGDKMVAIIKHGIIKCVPLCPIKETEGFIVELNTEELRDKFDRVE